MNGQDSAVNGVNKITLETIATTHDDLQQNYNALKDRYDVMAKRLEEIEAQNNLMNLIINLMTPMKLIK